MPDAAPKLTPILQGQLELIEPSVFAMDAVLYPCSARLVDGVAFDCVYFVEPATFRRLFRGIGTGSVPGLPLIRAEEVVLIKESPARLPARFANEIYRAGEHWGSHSFTLVFSWWCRSSYLVDGFVDFLKYPCGRGPSDVKDVVLFQHNKDATPVPLPYWCVFSR